MISRADGDGPATINVLDLYKQVLPRTNCRECGLATCLAFASAVVIQKRPLANCPHVPGPRAREVQAVLDAQQDQGRGLERNLSEDALNWARQRASSMRIEDMPVRIGGTLAMDPSGPALILPYFTGLVRITKRGISDEDGAGLDVWDKVLLYNHMAQGGSAPLSGEWIGLEQIPGSTSKVKSLAGVAEDPIAQRFDGRRDELSARAASVGGADVSQEYPFADLALRFSPLERVPLLLLFWEGDATDGLGAKVKILYDRTVQEHLDIESIVFLTERLARMLCVTP